MEKFNYKDAKILVVDDVEEVLNSTRNCLKLQGMQVACLSNPIEALEYLRKNKIDVLLLDFFMPEMNGDEFIKELRKFDNETVVILRTGYSDKVPPLEIIDELNIQGYIDKIKGKDELILLTKSAIKTAFLNRTIKKQETKLDAQEYRNQFLGNFLNLLMGEIKERTFAMSGNLITLEELKTNVEEEKRSIYERALQNIKNATSQLTGMIEKLEINNSNITIGELKSTITGLYEIKLGVKSIKLNIKQNFDSDYELIKCKASTIIYIIVDIIEYLIDKNEENINILIEKESNNMIIKICNKIENEELKNKINKLALLDNNIKICDEFKQITIIIE